MILSVAKRDVVTASPDATVRDVAGQMQYYGLGCVVVVEDGRPVGLVTDRDLVVRVLADPDAYPAQDIPVRQVMSRKPQTIREDESFSRALDVFRSTGFRRLPVVDRRGRLRGLVTLDDVLIALADNLEAVRRVVAHQSRGPKRPSRKAPTNGARALWT